MAPGSVENEQNNSLGEEEDASVKDKCRGDDKFRCGSTSTYICEVEKCDGTADCPNGEDEENCPETKPVSEGSGEEVDDNVNREEVDDNQEEPTVSEATGDFFYDFLL